MSSSSVSPVLLVVASAACASGTGAAPGAPAPAVVQRFAVASENLRVDKTGYADGDEAPDGVPDLVFQADFTGPAINVFLVARDPVKSAVFQWDTVTGEEPMPSWAQNGAIRGASTPGLAVFEAGARINYDDGSIPPLADRPHAIRLYASAEADVAEGWTAQLLLERADHSFASGPVITLHAADVVRASAKPAEGDAGRAGASEAKQ